MGISFFGYEALKNTPCDQPLLGAIRDIANPEGHTSVTHPEGHSNFSFRNPKNQRYQS